MNKEQRYAEAARIEAALESFQGRKELRSSIVSIIDAVRTGDMFWTVLMGIHLGVNMERAGIVSDEINAAIENRLKKNFTAANDKKAEKAALRYDEINKYIDDRIRNRGRHKTPSRTQIRNDAATAFGVSCGTVLNAQKRVGK